MYHGKRETPDAVARTVRAAPTQKRPAGGSEKRPIVALVERGGEARAFT